MKNIHLDTWGTNAAYLNAYQFLNVFDLWALYEIFDVSIRYDYFVAEKEIELNEIRTKLFKKVSE